MYRGDAQICNVCRIKHLCTDSDEGRELVRFLDAWPRTELTRLYLGLSLMLLALASLVVTVVLTRHHEPPEVVILGTGLSVILAVGRPILLKFR